MQMPYNVINNKRIYDVKQFAEGVNYFANERPQT